MIPGIVAGMRGSSVLLLAGTNLAKNGSSIYTVSDALVVTEAGPGVSNARSMRVMESGEIYIADNISVSRASALGQPFSTVALPGGRYNDAGIAAFLGRLVVGGDSAGDVMASVDGGASWSIIAPGAGSLVGSIGAKGVAVRFNGAIWTSTDSGASWSSLGQSAGANISASQPANGPQGVVFPIAASRVCHVSETFQVTNTVLPGGGAGYVTRCVAYGSLGFMAVTTEGKVFLSPDGISWTQVGTVATDIVAGASSKCYFAHGRYWLVSNPAVWHSVDGITWTRLDHPITSLTSGATLA